MAASVAQEAKRTLRRWRKARSGPSHDLLCAVRNDGPISSLPVWYGRINRTQARYIVDSGASRSFITPKEVARLGLRTSRAKQPLRVRHSSGQVEVAERIVRGVRLEVGPGWAALVDLHVLAHAPALGVVIGEDFLRQHLGALRYERHGNPSLELTLGNKRVTLEPGPNAWHEEAPPVGAAERLHSLDAINDSDEVLLCMAYSMADVMVLPARKEGAMLYDPELRRGFEQRVSALRGEEQGELTAEERGEWEQLEKEYTQLFDHSDYSNTAAPKMAMQDGQQSIPLEEGAPLPRIEKRGALNHEKVQATIEQVQSLVARGYVEPSAAPVAAPVLLVRKPDGSWRFTVDYRGINAITKDDSYLPPKPDVLYPQLQGAKYFARVDARDGFWGVPLVEEDRWKTAFQTPIGLYQWTVMPMGLKGSPAKFQRFMDRVLLPMLGRGVIVFVDDVLIYANSASELTARLRQVFELLDANHIKLKREKCAFHLTRVRFLGHMVDGDGLSADPTKVQAILDMPRPRNVRDVRALLGVVGFLRQYIPSLGDMVRPLHALTVKGVAMVWTDLHQYCMDLIVESLLSAQVLALPDPNREKAIMTDASDFSMGGVLLQWHLETDKWRPLAYASWKMTPQQASQAPTTKEFYAMVEALRKWDHELCNQSSVKVFSDHKPLEVLASGQIRLNAMIRRRLDELGSKGIKVQYVTAEGVGVADWLSRRPDHRIQMKEVAKRSLDQGLVPHPYLETYLPRPLEATLQAREELQPDVEPTPDPLVDPQLGDALRKATQADPHLQRILSLERNDQWRERHREHAGLLWNVYQDRMVVVVPDDAALRRQFIHEAHDSPIAGHLGPQKTYAKLARHATWRGMRRDVYAYVTQCNVCQRSKPAAHRLQGSRMPLPIPHRKWAWVTLDYVTGLPASGPHKYTAALVIVDKFTKMVRMFPCHPSITSEETADLFYREIFKLYGFPLRILSDRGPQFTAAIWRKLWNMTGTRLSLATADHPQTDGQSETGVRILTQLCRAFADASGDKWAALLPSLEFAYNDSEIRTTGATPFYLMYGQHPTTPLALALGKVEDAPSLADLREATLTARKLLVEVTRREAALENRRRTPTSFQPGEWAYIFRDKRVRAHKLEPIWEGPYEVVATPNPNTAVLNTPGRRHRTFNVEKLRKHHASANDMAIHISDHRYHTATDGCLELQYNVHGRWTPMVDVVQRLQGWPALQRYHASTDFTLQQLVGQLLRKRYGAHGRFLGRTAFYDPDDQLYQVVLEDGELDVMDAAEVRRLAYNPNPKPDPNLTHSRRTP